MTAAWRSLLCLLALAVGSLVMAADVDFPAEAGANALVLGRTPRLLVVQAAAGDSLASLARRFLGRSDLDWQIAEANGLEVHASAGTAPALTGSPVLVVPLVHPHPAGILPDGVQTVPVLTYLRFGSTPSKLTVSATQFEAHLRWLADHGVRVLPLAALSGFLDGRTPVPAKSAVITVDDGGPGFYELAFPLLKQFDMPATLFVATDSVGRKGRLSWAQLQEMAASGLVSVQAHSKSHANLIERAAGETDRLYRRRLEVEVQTPRKRIEQQLNAANARVTHFAYPYGAANTALLDTLQRNAFDLGLGMQPGGNAAFSHPHWLRRSLVTGDLDVAGFSNLLPWRRNLPP